MLHARLHLGLPAGRLRRTAHLRGWRFPGGLTALSLRTGLRRPRQERTAPPTPGPWASPIRGTVPVGAVVTGRDTFADSAASRCVTTAGMSPRRGASNARGVQRHRFPSMTLSVLGVRGGVLLTPWPGVWRRGGRRVNPNVPVGHGMGGLRAQELNQNGSRGGSMRLWLAFVPCS